MADPDAGLGRPPTPRPRSDDAADDTADGPAEPLRAIVAFGRILRRAGLPVGTGRLLSFAEAVSRVDPRDRRDVYWAGRTTLVTRADDIPLYDAAFAVFWDRLAAVAAPEEAAPVEPSDDGPPTEDDSELGAAGLHLLRSFGLEQPDDAAPDGDQVGPAAWSPVEVLRAKDFSDYQPEEYLLARHLMNRLRADPPQRLSRRPESARRGALDLRRTLRRSLRTGGEPVERRHRSRGVRPRRVVLLADVSGSMERYSRALLQFLHASVAGGRHVEAFVFGTRLTRVTKELRSPDPDRALADASRAVVDWGGGTRIGTALAEFNDRWGQRGMARGAVVIILSDGWERGGVERLSTEMARLHRLSWRLVWVNPLKAAPGYAPLAAGMVAALPYIDDFVEGHNLASLESLCALLERVTGRERLPA